MTAPAKCIGILGRLFGHRFLDGTWTSDTYTSDYCSRCGMPKGGWTNREQ